jgi:hypothetical protein
MTELLSNELFLLVSDDGFLRVTRSAAPSPGEPAEMAARYAALASAMRRSGVRRLLLDLRGGPPGRNDPEFERAGEEWRRSLASDFDRIAILVRTAVGKLHVQRLGREAGRAPAIFMSEAEAVAHLRAEGT